jgi:hypothetical protein
VNKIVCGLVALIQFFFYPLNVNGLVPSAEEQIKIAVQALAQAQKHQERDRVYMFSSFVSKLLGSRLAIPEKPESYYDVNSSLPSFPRTNLEAGFDLYLKELKRNSWWKKYPASKECPEALRVVASVIVGCIQAVNAGCSSADDLGQIAREAGDYLLYTQAVAGNGVFPIPDLRGRGGRLDELLTRFLKEAEKKNLLDQALKDGWIVEDFESGDLFFDHGLCAFALLQLFEFTKEKKYLQSVLWAEQWQESRPCVPNWNYNSFSVLFLSRLAKVSNNPVFLHKALRRIDLGVLPGLICSGEFNGRWNDPHNALFVYHMIMMRSFIELIEAIHMFPEQVPNTEIVQVFEAFDISFETRLEEMFNKGLAHPDILSECFSRMLLSKQIFHKKVQDQRFQKVWEDIQRFVYDHDTHDKPYLSPAARGYFLLAIKVSNWSASNNGIMSQKLRSCETISYKP